jgi:hypothetical protein
VNIRHLNGIERFLPFHSRLHSRMWPSEPNGPLERFQVSSADVRDVLDELSTYWMVFFIFGLAQGSRLTTILKRIRKPIPQALLPSLDIIDLFELRFYCSNTSDF